jgi:hypothetical protein
MTVVGNGHVEARIDSEVYSIITDSKFFSGDIVFFNKGRSFFRGFAIFILNL